MRAILLSLLVSVAVGSPRASEFVVRDTLRPSCPETPPEEFATGALLTDTGAGVVLVADAGASDVAVLDPETLEIVECFDVGRRPSRLALDETRRRLYVVDWELEDVVVLDADTHALLDTILVSPDPDRIGVNTQTQKLYVTQYGYESVAVVDAVADTMIKSIWVGPFPGVPSVSESLNRVYVPVWGGYIAVIDGEHDIVQEWSYQFGGPCEPEYSWYNESENWLYVMAFNCPILKILDGATLLPVTTDIWLPGYPIWIFGDEETNRAFVSADTTLAVIGPEHVIDQNVELGSYYAVNGCGDFPSKRLFIRGSKPPPEGDRAILVLEESASDTRDPIAQRFHQGPILFHSPVPFHSTSRILLQVPADEDASLRVYDASGRLIRNLVHGSKATGVRSIRWDGADDQGRRVPSGVYFYRLQTPHSATTQRTILLR